MEGSATTTSAGVTGCALTSRIMLWRTNGGVHGVYSARRGLRCRATCPPLNSCSGQFSWGCPRSVYTLMVDLLAGREGFHRVSHTEEVHAGVSA